jgi:hypothetical protein
VDRRNFQPLSLFNSCRRCSGTSVFLFHHPLCPDPAALVRGYGLHSAASRLYPGSRAASIRCRNCFSTLVLIPACHSGCPPLSPPG